MSSSDKPNINGSGNRKKNKRAVRFVDAPDEAEQQQQDTSGAVAVGRRIKRPRIERPNEDEDDDVDDWQDDEEHVGASSKELLDAKRSRRLKHEGFDDDADNENGEETNVDAATSLLAEQDDNDEVPIEPFNLNAERTDGQGYFDGETYVFRKRNVDEEPDAWLEGLADQKTPATSKQDEESSSASGGDVDADDDADRMDDWNREELYAKILPLVSDTETIVQALVRYGDLLKRQRANDKTSSSAAKMAQEALNDLTEASNALLLKGDVDIYEKTRSDLMKLVPSAAATDTTKSQVKWEYKGNQDGEIHGPYTTQEMQSWIQAGYFVGAQAVQIRTVMDNKTDNDDRKATPQKPTVDDLLSDLMDDDNDTEEDKKQNGEQKQDAPKQARGEWMSSNDVDFASFAGNKTT